MAVAPVRMVTSVQADARRQGRGAARFRSALSSRLYVPACAIAVVAAALVGIGWATHWGGSDLGGSVRNLWVITVGPLALLVLGAILVMERVRPAQRRPLVARGHRQDLLYAFLHIGLVLPLVGALSLTFAEVVRRTMPWLVLPRMGLVPRWLAIAVIFVAYDGCNWLIHLANHRSPMLWRFHELHHSQEDLNALTVFRTHPLINVSYLFALLPGTVLLANGAITTMLFVGYGCMVAMAHSNTNLGFGWLDRVFVSPNYHRIHHRLNGAQDVNLAFTLTIWDQLARRAVFPTPETIRMDTGLPHRPLAVEQEGPRPRHLAVMAAQLVGPFRPMTEPVELLSVRHQGGGEPEAVSAVSAVGAPREP